MYQISILGQEVSFRTNADEARVRDAEQLVKQAFDQLNTHGTRLNNEKLLILVALRLADEYLQARQELQDCSRKLSQLLETIDSVNSVQE